MLGEGGKRKRAHQTVDRPLLQSFIFNTKCLSFSSYVYKNYSYNLTKDKYAKTLQPLHLLFLSHSLVPYHLEFMISQSAQIFSFPLKIRVRKVA